jgi:hypothetical protein
MKMAVITTKWVLPFLLVAMLWGSDPKAKTETVKGYVLDSACAFTKGLEKPISREMCDCLREGWFAPGAPER